MSERNYVTMIDTFLSGWGRAEGKANKLIFICNSYEEAEIVADNARHRSDMKNIVIRQSFPHINQSTQFVQTYTKEDYPKWYVPGYFKNLYGPERGEEK